MATGDPFAEHPGQRRSSGGNDGVQQGHGSQAVGFEVGTGVEAEPADPQEAGADKREGEVVRLHGFLAETDAGTRNNGGHEACDTGIDVDNSAAGKVNRTLAEQETGRS